MSDEQPSVVELMGRVMREVSSVSKSDINDHFKFSFRGIDTILKHVGPALRLHGVVVIPEVREQKSEVVGKQVRVTLTVAYTFHGPKGDSLTAVVPGEAMDAQDKASSKAMSVAFRTALIQALAIPTGERDPHAGPAASTKLVRLQAEVKKVMADKGWDWPQLAQDYTEWSQGADIVAADENDLTAYLKYLNPQGTKTMQRQPVNGRAQ
jgi:hypothetical protein